MRTYVDEHDELKIVRKTFYNLSWYNGFVKDTYETNKVKHFELILASNGFDLSTQGQPNRLAKETRNQQSQVVAELNDELFMEYLAPETDHFLPKFTKLIDTLLYLQPPANDPEVLIRSKDIIMDKSKRG